MMFDKNTTPEVVKILCSNQARTFFIQKYSVLKNCRSVVSAYV